MKKFIVIQMQINEEIMIKGGKTKNIVMENVVRQIEAENKETAIGKFVLATQNIKAKQKLNIECIELPRLLKVD